MQLQEEMTMTQRVHSNAMSRRGLLQASTALAGASLAMPFLALPALAEDHPAIGTYPAGSSGSSVFVGITTPRGSWAWPCTWATWISQLRAPQA